MKLEKHPRLLIWLSVVLAAMAVLFLGMWLQERNLIRAYRDESACWNVLHQLGPGYDRLRVIVSSHPKATLVGSVETPEALHRLEDHLAQELEPDCRERVLMAVRVTSFSDGKAQ